MELKTRGCNSYVYEKIFQVEPLKTSTPVKSNSKILINDIINLFILNKTYQTIRPYEANPCC